jgi:hypothetical protein
MANIKALVNTTSGFLKLNARDFLLGLAIAVGTGVVDFAYNAIKAGSILNMDFLRSAGLAAVSAILAYLTKNFFTNNVGKFNEPDVAIAEPVVVTEKPLVVKQTITTKKK